MIKIQENALLVTQATICLMDVAKWWIDSVNKWIQREFVWSAIKDMIWSKEPASRPWQQGAPISKDTYLIHCANNNKMEFVLNVLADASGAEKWRNVLWKILIHSNLIK